MNAPTVLALEFSSDRRSVALIQSGRVLAESTQELGRSTRVFSLIAETLKLAGLTPSSVSAIAVGMGPGSYTGIRLAISTAQGWALARPGPALRIIGINSFEVLAVSVSGTAWLASDAQREEWAVAPVEDGQLVQSARLLSSSELQILAQTSRVIGPDVVRTLGVGEVGYPSAKILGLLAENRAESIPPESLAPVYLRPAAFKKAPEPRILPGITHSIEGRVL